MMMGLLGAGLSLQRAEPLANTRRTLQILLEQSVALTESPGQFLATDLEDAGRSEWFVGFHLNNAEQRLSAVYEQLLKTLLSVSKGDVPKLEKEMRRRGGGSPDLRKTFESAATAVSRIRKRTNEWKHNASPDVDQEDPAVRLHDAERAFENIVSFFVRAAIDKHLIMQ
jgi:hypothetical protein